MLGATQWARSSGDTHRKCSAPGLGEPGSQGATHRLGAGDDWAAPSSVGSEAKALSAAHPGGVPETSGLGMGALFPQQRFSLRSIKMQRSLGSTLRLYYPIYPLTCTAPGTYPRVKYCLGNYL